VQLAESVGRPTRQGNTLLVNQSALSATLNAGQSHTFDVRVTNEGSSSQTIAPSVSGSSSHLSSDTGTVTLTSASPSYIDGEGRTAFPATHTSSVAAGAHELNGNIAWNAQQIGGVACETLFDPSGNVAAYSVLGTNRSGFGHVEVQHPAAGTWTAVIFT